MRSSNRDNCDPKDIAIKSFFLGPQSENEAWLKEKWNLIIENWLSWRRSRFPQDGRAVSPEDQSSPSFKNSLGILSKSVSHILEELEQETAKFSPRYIGHMVSEISLPALLGHVCALLHNPNNTSREVSRVTSRLEEEAIQDLAKMLGYRDEKSEGHFTSGGTVANVEAMWRAWSHLDRNLTLSILMKKQNPDVEFMNLAHLSPKHFQEAIVKYGFENQLFKESCLSQGPWHWAKVFKNAWGFDFNGPVILVPANKHYSWKKAVALLGFGEESLWTIELDEFGRPDLADLRRKIENAYDLKRPVLMVVSVAGTTEMGEVDPIHEVRNLLEKIEQKSGGFIWHHVDAAYGGYYTSMLYDSELEIELGTHNVWALKAISRTQSITIDPHKLGYVPYSCGAIITKNADFYQTRQFQAPYLEHKNDSRWMHTLEGSRGGAGATATWLSNKTLGLNADGHGRLLSKGLEAKDLLVAEIQKHLPEVAVQTPHDLNILCLSAGQPGGTLSEANQKTKQIYEKFCASPNFSVSKTVLSMAKYKRLIERSCRERQMKIDTDQLFLLRLVLMNPFIVSKETTTKFVSEFVAELKRFQDDQ